MSCVFLWLLASICLVPGYQTEYSGIKFGLTKEKKT